MKTRVVFSASLLFGRPAKVDGRVMRCWIGSGADP
jgi:hypothetical protein